MSTARPIWSLFHFRDVAPCHASAINMPQDRNQTSATRTETVKLRKLKGSGDTPHVLQNLPGNCPLFFMAEHALVRETS